MMSNLLLLPLQTWVLAHLRRDALPDLRPLFPGTYLPVALTRLGLQNNQAPLCSALLHRGLPRPGVMLGAEEVCAE